MTHNQTLNGFIGKSPITVGRYTYGFENLALKQWGEGASLSIGSKLYYNPFKSNLILYNIK